VDAGQCGCITKLKTRKLVQEDCSGGAAFLLLANFPQIPTGKI